MKKGLMMVYTGDGERKTTAAVGQVFRALGQGFKVCVIQFNKGSRNYGALATTKQFKDSLELHMIWQGVTRNSKNIHEDTTAAKKAWQFAKEVIGSGKFGLVVLDELTDAMKHGILDSDEVLKVLTSIPESLHLIVTGREAPEELIEAADLVTEMKEIKHRHEAGIKARRGEEF